MEKKRNIDKMNDFVVIGAGRLGRSVAEHLYSAGKEVLVIDKNQANVNMLNGKVSTAVAGLVCSHSLSYHHHQWYTTT